jgi:hypothetical protein
MLIAIGDGGPADPKRYWLNPMLTAMSGTKDDFRQSHGNARARKPSDE